MPTSRQMTPSSMTRRAVSSPTLMATGIRTSKMVRMPCRIASRPPSAERNPRLSARSSVSGITSATKARSSLVTVQAAAVAADRNTPDFEVLLQ
jgi:hypothetical protein